MTYFRNKFNEEFLELCNDIEPKGMDDTAISDYSNIFTEYRRRPDHPFIEVMPLVLYNILESSNPRDRNVEDYMMLCEDSASTVITASWDETHKARQEGYVCDLLDVVTGDFKEEE